jgi:hypothetical protein
LPWAKTPGAIAAPALGARQRKVDDRFEPPSEGIVDIVPQVRGEDRDAVERLDALKQEGDFLVGVAVMRVVRLGPLAEQGVGLRRTTGFQPSCCTWSNTRAKFFSVSPMYFETTSDRSTLYTSRPVDWPKRQAVNCIAWRVYTLLK